MLEQYAMVLALNALLIEKGLLTREEIELTKNKIMGLLANYNKMMVSPVESKEEELKKLDEIDKASEELSTVCHFHFDDSVKIANRKLREQVITAVPPDAKKE